MITLNIGWILLIGIFLIVVGFCISAFFAGSKISELDTEINNLKIDNNRKDTVIKFYQAQESTNASNTKSNKN